MFPNREIDLFGNARIRAGQTEIKYHYFGAKPKIKTLYVPGTVKYIRDNGFFGCQNLTSVTLCEGIQVIEDFAFNCCSSLRSLVVPDSVTKMSGLALNGVQNLEAPVYNASRTTLYYCPPQLAGSRFVIPQGVRRITEGAFWDCPDLKEVVLPDTLEVIESRAFHRIPLARIVLPKSLRQVSSEAFYECRELRSAVVPDPDVLAPGAFQSCPVTLDLGTQILPDRHFHILGLYFLQTRQVKLSESAQAFIRQEPQRTLAQRCGQADGDAMLQLSDAFRSGGEEEFFQLAANFWLYRASLFGCAEAQARMDLWFHDHGLEHMPSVMNERLTGTYSGQLLQALGFPFFTPREDAYSIGLPDADGVREVSSYAGEDGPDESGFGSEIFYDWWYVDDCLNGYPKFGFFHAYSHLDRRNHEAQFQAIRDQVAARGRHLRRNLLR